MNNQRKQLYDGLAMGAVLQEPVQLGGISVPPVFRQVAGKWIPILHEVPIPVRAIVLPLFQQAVATRLSAVIQFHARKLAIEGSIWFQDPKLYHLTIYHASTDQVNISILTKYCTCTIRFVEKSCTVVSIQEKCVLV